MRFFVPLLVAAMVATTAHAYTVGFNQSFGTDTWSENGMAFTTGVTWCNIRDYNGTIHTGTGALDAPAGRVGGRARHRPSPDTRRSRLRRQHPQAARRRAGRQRQ